MPPKRDLKALAEAAGLTKQHNMNQEQNELEFKFKMGVKAPVGWEKGVYQGTSVGGKVELVKIV